MVSNTGEVGASKLTTEVLDIITKVQNTVQNIASQSASGATVGT